MKSIKSLSTRLLLVAIASLGYQAAGAATLGVQVYDPDLSSPGATINYDFTALCTSSNGGVGTAACGTRDKGKDYDVLSEADSFGLLTISMSGNQVLTNIDGDFEGIAGGSYSLTANFDGAGSFVDGTVVATGTSIVAGSDFTSGTIVTGDLTDFGYGGSGAAGTFDFFFDNVGGDMAAFYTTYAGIVINTSTLSSASGNWDTGGLDFQANFSATSANVNTTVPIPAAIWLFGSGLLGLFGSARARRKTVCG